MGSVKRFFVGGLPVTIIAVVALMLATPAALAGTGTCKPKLVFQVQPTTTQVQTAMTPAVVVDVENSQGYLDSSYNRPVTLTYAVNPVGAPEPANNVVYAVGGVATFPALTFSVIGIGFELKASAEQATSSPSQPFGIGTVSQPTSCQAGQTCQTQTVSSDGTSGFTVAPSAPTSAVLIASAGFPPLSCTTYGGVVGFTITTRAKIITLTLAGGVARMGNGKHLNICFGSPTPFITKDGSTSTFFARDNQYEGLLPTCKRGPQPCIASQRPQPCIASQRKSSGAIVTTIDAPVGDPYFSY
jgi:hypothetical protein